MYKRQHHICDDFTKDFANVGNLSEYTLINSDEKKHWDDICYEAFKHTQQLTQHEVIDRSFKKYQCDVCKTAFTCCRT